MAPLGYLSSLIKNQDLIINIAKKIMPDINILKSIINKEKVNNFCTGIL